MFIELETLISFSCMRGNNVDCFNCCDIHVFSNDTPKVFLQSLKFNASDEIRDAVIKNFLVRT